MQTTITGPTDLVKDIPKMICQGFKAKGRCNDAFVRKICKTECSGAPGAKSSGSTGTSHAERKAFRACMKAERKSARQDPSYNHAMKSFSKCMQKTMGSCGYLWWKATNPRSYLAKLPEDVAEYEWRMFQSLQQGMNGKRRGMRYIQRRLKVMKHSATTLAKAYATGKLPGTGLQYTSVTRDPALQRAKYRCEPLTIGLWRGYVCKAKKGNVRVTCTGITHKVNMIKITNDECGSSVKKNGCLSVLPKPIHKEVVCRQNGKKRGAIGSCTSKKVHDCLPGMSCSNKEDSTALAQMLLYF